MSHASEMDSSTAPEIELYEVSDDAPPSQEVAPREQPSGQPPSGKTPNGQKSGAKPPSQKQPSGKTPPFAARPQAKPSQPPAAALDEDGHRTVLIDGELFSVVEGDLVFDIDQKLLWREATNARRAQYSSRLRAEAVGLGEASLSGHGAVSSALVGIMQDGKLVRWSPGTELSYCVLKNTFPRPEWYEEVVANMERATEAWEAVCGVRFRHFPDHDGSASVRPAGVLFPVRYISAGGAFIAAAFFPNDPPSRRRLLIDPSYFTTGYDHVGVLRHELGHVLGFRHEHIRSGAPSVCPHEDTTGTFDITAYDPKSVMHYFCGGVGSRSLAITEIDRIGAQQLYGPPLSSFQCQEV